MTAVVSWEVPSWAEMEKNLELKEQGKNKNKN